MQRFFFFFLMSITFSCKKKTDDNSGFPLAETNWNLHFKNNSTFSFFAESELHFAADKKIQNFRNVDTVSGTWKTTVNTVTIHFDNGDIYNGAVITSDSLYGTLAASGSSGTWYALRK